MRKETNSVTPTQEGDDGFLSRWSKRKQGLQSEEVRSELEAVEEADLAEAAEEKLPEKSLTDEDMPSIETLNETSDYSGFMSPEVSGELKKLALRKLFRSAKFNITDGLDDYDDDFRSFAALGDLITSDMKHRMEVEAEKKKLAEEEAAKAAEEKAAAEASEDQEEVAKEDTKEDAQERAEPESLVQETEGETDDPEDHKHA